jgi:hypothetical protein
MLKLTKKTKEIAFYIGSAAYLAILYLSSAKLAPASKAFPFAIIGLSVLIILLKFLTYRFPKLRFLDPGAGKIKKQEGETDLIAEEDNGAPATEIGQKQLSPGLTVVLFLVWLATFPVGIYLFGFLPTMLIWMLIFMIGLSRLGIKLSLILSIGTFSAMYAAFGLLLKLHFGSGILF